MGKVGSFFVNECVDIVERGRSLNIKISNVRIEGIYQDEIFGFDYVPEEEGYDEGR